jgi:hypothetical protein
MPTPTKYRREVADKIISAVSNGKPLKTICNELGIPRETVIAWALDDRDDFGERLKEACFWRTDVWADEILEMSDASRGKDMAGVQSHKLSVDSRKWLLSKLRPDQFGDRVQVEHIGRTYTLPPGHPDGFAGTPAMVIEGKGVTITLPDNRRSSDEAIDGQAIELEGDGTD